VQTTLFERGEVEINPSTLRGTDRTLTKEKNCFRKEESLTALLRGF